MNDGEGPPAEPAAEGEGRRGGHRARARTRQGDQRRPNRWRSRTKDQSERSHGGAVDDWAPTPRAKKTARAPSEASRQRRGRRGGHRAEPPKGKSGKGDNCTKQLYLVAKRTIALAIAPNAVFGATVGFTPPAEPPRRTRGGAAEPLTEKTRRVGRGVSSVGAPPERAMPGRRAMRGTARQSEQTPHHSAGPRTTVRLQAPRCRSLYIRRRSS